MGFSSQQISRSLHKTPHFKLNFYNGLPREKPYNRVSFEWYNELRTMEAEVNLHILRMLPSEYENYILAHQVCFLAMLFDFSINEGHAPSKTTNSTSVVDIGLSKPDGKILAKSFRGRERRKMISWKDMECTPGYPC